MNVQGLEDLFGALGHTGLVHHDACQLGVTPQPEVVLYAAGQSLVELLVHHGHAVFQRVLGVFEIDLFAFQEDLAGVLAVDAEQTFHQGGFTCAVFTHQGVNGAGPHGEVYPVQGLYAGKFLADAAHFKQYRLLHRFPPFLALQGEDSPSKPHTGPNGAARWTAPLGLCGV